jgi:GMP synthase (glutamine-hydrolysing)
MKESEADAARHGIAVIDLGGQYCHMIARRLSDIGVEAEILPHDAKSAALRRFAGIILSGGPQSVYDPASPSIDAGILGLEVPVLGICYGHQLLAKLLGAEVAAGSAEYGKATLHLRHANSLFHGTPERQTVWMSHADSVLALPPGMERLAETESCAIAAFADFAKERFGVQFHPEVAHTEHGGEMLKNFALGICGLRRQEPVKDRVHRLVAEIRERAGNRSVFFFVSGGVDSTVAFALTARTLPAERVLGLYVDTGLMRKHETAELRGLLDTIGLGDRLRIRDESARFMAALEGVVEPEEKRRIIGRLFIEVQQSAMAELGIDGEAWLLGQGTIYPDTIESGGASGTAALIKTHHNRCEEVRRLIAEGRVIEPLAEFYKDQVRELGRALGLDERLTERWPFPGPGLAIRCLCTNETRDVAPIELPGDAAPYRAVHVPIRSVGVQGDGRTYREVVALEGPLDYERLHALGVRLCNTGRAYNRVVLRLAGRAADLAEGRVVAATLDRARLDLLREADYLARQIMEAAGLAQTVWQFPVVLIPVSFGSGESIVLRPINSEDGMTANFARLPAAVLTKIADAIAALPGIAAVFLDITDKPPATIEWE